MLSFVNSVRMFGNVTNFFVRVYCASVFGSAMKRVMVVKIAIRRHLLSPGVVITTSMLQVLFPAAVSERSLIYMVCFMVSMIIIWAIVLVVVGIAVEEFRDGNVICLLCEEFCHRYIIGVQERSHGIIKEFGHRNVILGKVVGKHLV